MFSRAVRVGCALGKPASGKKRAQFEAAVSQMTGLAMMHFYLALVYERTSRASEAMKEFQSALRSGPRHFPANLLSRLFITHKSQQMPFPICVKQPSSSRFNDPTPLPCRCLCAVRTPVNGRRALAEATPQVPRCLRLGITYRVRRGRTGSNGDRLGEQMKGCRAARMILPSLLITNDELVAGGGLNHRPLGYDRNSISPSLPLNYLGISCSLLFFPALSSSVRNRSTICSCNFSAWQRQCNPRSRREGMSQGQILSGHDKTQPL